MAVGGSGARERITGRRLVSVGLALTLSVALAGVAAGALIEVTPAPEQAGAAAPPGTATSGGGAGDLAAFYRAPSPLSDAPAGTLVRRQALPADPALPPGTRSWRILFHSTAADGGDLLESGMVVVPGGSPPPGGFPVVSWAHGTTGVAPGCAPSRTGTGQIPGLRSLVAHRMIVAAADYRGLGVAGYHPYLVGTSEAEDVLDAARAARSLAGSAASDAVVVAGFSQGGQAALFAGEVAPTYAPDLFLAGVAAVAPVTSALDLAPVGDQPPPSGQSAFTASVLWSWSHRYRSVRLAALLTPAGLAGLDVVRSACIDQVASVYDTMPPALFFRPGWQRSAAVVAADRANLPGAAPTAAPVLVVQGTADEVIPFGRTTRFVADRLCRAQFDAVDFEALAGDGHAQSLADAVPRMAAWFSARLAGASAPDTCGTGVLGASG